MDTSVHNITTLFDQLGLASDHESIMDFLNKNRLKHNQKLTEGKFWSPSQIAFLQEAIDDDSDWAEAVDHLDTELRH